MSQCDPPLKNPGYALVNVIKVALSPNEASLETFFNILLDNPEGCCQLISNFKFIFGLLDISCKLLSTVWLWSYNRRDSFIGVPKLWNGSHLGLCKHFRLFQYDLDGCWPHHRVIFTSVPLVGLYLYIFWWSNYGWSTNIINPTLSSQYSEVCNKRIDRKPVKAVTHKLCLFLLTGLMTDKLGSYTFTFYTAGVILIVGASITSLMACVKQQPEDAEEILETPSYGEKLLVTEKVTAVWALSWNWRREWPSNWRSRVLCTTIY